MAEIIPFGSRSRIGTGRVPSGNSAEILRTIGGSLPDQSGTFFIKAVNGENGGTRVAGPFSSQAEAETYRRQLLQEFSQYGQLKNVQLEISSG